VTLFAHEGDAGGEVQADQGRYDQRGHEGQRGHFGDNQGRAEGGLGHARVAGDHHRSGEHQDVAVVSGPLGHRAAQAVAGEEHRNDDPALPPAGQRDRGTGKVTGRSQQQAADGDDGQGHQRAELRVAVGEPRGYDQGQCAQREPRGRRPGP
jgi:hypothetical protein